MELRHLRYFVAVAEELNYRKASERLRVAQPALSSQIQDLEHELGVRLLDRDTGGVRLTDAGAAFLEESRALLAQAQQAAVVAREAAQGRRGRLQIGYSGPLLMGFMPATLKAFYEKFPHVDVALVEMPIAEQVAALESGAIHLAFAIAGAPPLPPDLEHIEVIRSPIRAVVGRGHRLARRPRVALAELAHEALLCISNRKVLVAHGEIMRRIFAVRGLKTGPIRSIEGAEAFRATLESGMGASLIAEVGALYRSRDLVFKPLKDTGDDLILELDAVWRRDQTSQLVANFIDLMKQPGPRAKPSGRAAGGPRKIRTFEGVPRSSP
jgi:DNA-binding transcriptional LysR family regulator